RDAFAQLHGRRERIVGDRRDETDRERLGRVDRSTGEDEVECATETDDAWQPPGAAVDERDAPPALEAPEGRAWRRDAQVAPQRELESTGNRPAVDRGDRRLGCHPSRETQRTVRAGRARRERV